MQDVQVRFCRALHRFDKPLRIRSAHAEFRKLEAQQLQRVLNPRKHAYRNNFHFASRNHCRNQPVACRIIFDNSRVLRQAFLQIAQREIRRRFKSRILALVRRQFPQRSHQLFLVRLCLLLQRRNAVLGVALRAELLQFNPVVIPVQVLAQIADSPHQSALSRLAHRQTLAAAKNHFAHASGFRRLDARKRLGCRLFTRRPRQQNIHQRFVHLQSIAPKRNLQLFRMDSRSQRFQRLPCHLVGIVRCGKVAVLLRQLPKQKLHLVLEHRRLDSR